MFSRNITEAESDVFLTPFCWPLVLPTRPLCRQIILYPEYGFAKHKGYGTKQHLEAIEKYGVLEIHRESYGPIAKQKIKQLQLF